MAHRDIESCELYLTFLFTGPMHGSEYFPALLQFLNCLFVISRLWLFLYSNDCPGMAGTAERGTAALKAFRGILTELKKSDKVLCESNCFYPFCYPIFILVVLYEESPIWVPQDRSAQPSYHAESVVQGTQWSRICCWHVCPVFVQVWALLFLIIDFWKIYFVYTQLVSVLVECSSYRRSMEVVRERSRRVLISSDWHFLRSMSRSRFISWDLIRSRPRFCVVSLL